MLTRHRLFRRHRHQRRRIQPAPAVPVGLIAAPALVGQRVRPDRAQGLHTALTLPSLAGIPAAFVSRDTSGTGQIKACAVTLADAGILRPEHISLLRQPKPNQTLAAVFKAETELVAKQLIEIALADLARQNRPRPLVKLAVMVASDCSLFNQDDYDSLRCNETKGGLLVSCDCQNPVHLEIGPNLQRLEQRHPGLGQTVLYWLSEGLNATVRACDPRTAVHWASYNYWQGGDDESDYVEEQMDDLEHYHKEQQAKLPEAERKPFSREVAIKEIGVFTRAEFDQQIPQAICSGKPKLSHPQLVRLRSRTRQPVTRIIDATLAVMQCRPGDAPKNDLADLEFTSWYVCPYLLRWHRPDKGDAQDPLGMIWDDYLNNEYQAGETNLTANGAFLWRQDEPNGIVNAFRRFETFCRTLQVAEDLLTAMQPREI